MPVTIQATGKLPKLLQLIGVLLICAMPIACAAGSYDTTAYLLLSGAALYAIGRFSAWWFHG
jgi:hypothetical protein